MEARTGFRRRPRSLRGSVVGGDGRAGVLGFDARVRGGLASVFGIDEHHGRRCDPAPEQIDGHLLIWSFTLVAWNMKSQLLACEGFNKA